MSSTQKKLPGRLIHAFIGNEKSGGILLIFCTVLSLILANNPAVGESYRHFWHMKIPGGSPEFWINDGLMAIFFLLVGLEIKHELYSGELADVRKSLLPVVAALGGMIVPALIHFLFNHGTVSSSGLGIPMATDIAFSLGVLSLLGNKVPLSLKIFLTALAIIDDLGAIIVIAVFYSSGFNAWWFAGAIAVFLLLLFLNKRKIDAIWPYLLFGAAMWYALLNSGIHATIAGVLTAFALPYRKDSDSHSPSIRLMDLLEQPVAFFILPAFAMANTAIIIQEGWQTTLLSLNSLGIEAGLIAGKPIGIILFSLLGVAAGICRLPERTTFLSFIGVSMLAGIGFTMSIFISLLAFDSDQLQADSKIAVLIASGVSAILGYFVLKISLLKTKRLK